MKKKALPLILLVVFIVCVLCFVGGGLGSLLILKSTPQYSIYELGHSIENKDYESFSKYFDSGDVVTSAVEEYAKEQGEDDSYGYGGYLSYLTTYIKDGSEQEFKKKVENGDLLKQDGVKQIVDMNLVEVFSATKVVRDGKIATLTLNLGSDQIDFRMRQKDGNWQVFEIKNWNKIVNPETFKFGFSDLYDDMPSPSDPFESTEELVSKNMSEAIETTDFTVTVNSTREANTLDNDYGAGKKASENAKFVFVSMKIVNTSKSEVYVDSNMFSLKDDQDRTYESDFSYYGDKSLSYQSIAAGLTASGELAFEVPNDAASYSIEIHDSTANKVYTVKVK